MTETESQNRPSAVRKRRRGRLAAAAQISAIIIVPVTIAGIVLQALSGEPEPTPDIEQATATSPAATGPAGPGTDTEPAEPSGSREAFQYLAELTPIGGGANLQPLPRMVADDPGYSRALAIPCGSGQVDDQFREVTYSLRGRYLRMDAVVRPLQDPYSPINIQVQVFRDEEQVQNVVMDVGETRPVRADIEAGDELRIRVTCELSSPTVILTDATVTAA